MGYGKVEVLEQPANGGSAARNCMQLRDAEGHAGREAHEPSSPAKKMGQEM